MLDGAVLVVEIHHLGSATDEVGHNEADAGEQFARVLFDLGDHSAWVVPRSSLIREAMVGPLKTFRRSAHGTFQQISDVLSKDGVSLESDGVSIALGFEQLVQLGDGKRRIGSKKAERFLSKR